MATQKISKEMNKEYMRIRQFNGWSSPRRLNYWELIKFQRRLNSLFGRVMSFREAKVWEYRMIIEKDCHE